MVQKSLVEYIKSLLKQGYDVNTIKRTLLQAGYSTYDIQEALTYAKRTPITKPLLIAFGIIVALIAIVLTILAFTGGEPAELYLSLTPYDIEVVPGEQILVNAAIENPSGTKTKGLLDISISGPRPITAPSQKIEVKDRTSVPITVTIPYNSPQGQYTLQATLSYDNRRTTKTQQFTVSATAPQQEQPAALVDYLRQEQAREQQTQCPQGCDDLNPCTKDECKNGQCIHTPITPCCGNNICEEGEEGCPDCKPDIIEEAASAARADPTGALKKCKDAAQKDACIKEVATAANDKTICTQIMEPDIKDACLMHFAFNKDFTVCEQITNQYTKNSCYTLKNLAKYE